MLQILQRDPFLTPDRTVSHANRTQRVIAACRRRCCKAMRVAGSESTPHVAPELQDYGLFLRRQVKAKRKLNQSITKIRIRKERGDIEIAHCTFICNFCSWALSMPAADTAHVRNHTIRAECYAEPARQVSCRRICLPSDLESLAGSRDGPGPINLVRHAVFPVPEWKLLLHKNLFLCQRGHFRPHRFGRAISIW